MLTHQQGHPCLFISITDLVIFTLASGFCSLAALITFKSCPLLQFCQQQPLVCSSVAPDPVTSSAMHAVPHPKQGLGLSALPQLLIHKNQSDSGGSGIATLLTHCQSEKWHKGAGGAWLSLVKHWLARMLGRS